MEEARRLYSPKLLLLKLLVLDGPLVAVVALYEDLLLLSLRAQ